MVCLPNINGSLQTKKKIYISPLQKLKLPSANYKKHVMLSFARSWRPEAMRYQADSPTETMSTEADFLFCGVLFKTHLIGCSNTNIKF